MKSKFEFSSRLSALILGAGVATIAMTACLGGAYAQERTKVTFAVAVSALPVSTGPYSSLPAVLGYWEEEGLDVDVIGVGGSSLAMQMVASGQADFATPGLPYYLATREQTDNVTANYCIFAHNQFGIVSMPGSEIKDITDMEGHSFAVTSLASAAVLYAQAAMIEAGVSPDSVELLPVSGSPSALATVLQNGTVIGIAGYDSVNAGAASILDIEMNKLKTPFDDTLKCGLVLATRKDYVEQNPEVAVSIARGVAKATAFAEANPEAAIKLHWQVYPESKQSSAMGDPMKAAMVELNARLDTMVIDWRAGEKWGAPISENLEKYEQFLVDAEKLKVVMPAEEIFDDSMIDAINDWDKDALFEQAQTMMVD